MKALLRAPVAAVFAALARAVIRKYRPLIVMVTGSVGKTSTKDAVAAALSPRFHLRASEKSYNSEFGVPLTIIGCKNPWTDPFAWMKVITEALALILLPNHYPKLLVLEVGADRPGDLRQILKIATPTAVVVTKLPDVPVHVEAYASPAAVRDEEFTPALALPPGAPLIVCADDAYAMELASRVNATRVTYGYESGADVRLSRPELLIEGGSLKGMYARAEHAGRKCILEVRGALGRQQLFAPAAALATARAFGMSVEEALKGLATYAPPAGRARILAGKNLTTLIDDTYNASPAAAEEILDSLSLVQDAKRRIAILGDMLELGRFSRKEHERIGTLAAEHADMVIAVGERSAAIASAARAAGKEKVQVMQFVDSAAAARALGDLPRPGDLILIKGSQGMRMERITEALLADPLDAEKLVRQEPQWKKR